MTRVRRRCIEVESNILQVEGIVVILRSRFDIVANSAYSRSCGQTYAERTGPSPQLCSPAGPHRAAHGTDRAEQVGEAGTLLAQPARPHPLLVSRRGSCGPSAVPRPAEASAALGPPARNAARAPQLLDRSVIDSSGRDVSSIATRIDSASQPVRRLHNSTPVATSRKRISSCVLSDGKCHIPTGNNTSVRIYRFAVLSIIASIKPNSHGLSDNECQSRRMLLVPELITAAAVA